MKLQEWFDTNGSFEKGVELYSQLPNAKQNLLRSFKIENFSNMLMLKYELKRAINLGIDVGVERQKKATETSPVIVVVKEGEVPIKYIIEQSNKKEFSTETMAMYPMELHSIYRERISNFYHACELKFKLNRLPAEDEKGALELILQLEGLWSKIDKAWVTLNYWKENNRLMPIEQSVDYSKLTPMQLHKEKGLIEVRISKRKKTVLGFENHLEQNPNDKTKLNLYHKKVEDLEQLNIDLQTIKKLINE